jgi:hypothetical protein
MSAALANLKYSDMDPHPPLSRSITEIDIPHTRYSSYYYHPLPPIDDQKSFEPRVSKMDSPLMPRFPFLPNCFVECFINLTTLRESNSRSSSLASLLLIHKLRTQTSCHCHLFFRKRSGHPLAQKRTCAPAPRLYCRNRR